MLNRRSKALQDIVSTLRMYYDNVDEDQLSGQEEGVSSRKEILQNLIAFLEGS